MIFDRRKFLCGATATVLSVPSFFRSLEAEAAGTTKNLIVVQLDGGNDAYNMVVPLQAYGPYQDLRSNIAVTEAQIASAGTAFDPNYATAASAATTYGFHPYMTALRAQYATGNVAIVMGVGLPANAADRDGHEQAKFAWDVAGINNFDQTNLGWLGQTFDQLNLPASTLPPQASMDGTMPLCMNGKIAQTIAVNYNLTGFTISSGSSGSDATARLNALNGNDAYTTRYNPSEFARALGTATVGYVGAVKTVATAEPLADYITTYSPTPGGTATTSYLKLQLQQVARLILGGAPTRAYRVHQGGYDTHANQNAAQPQLLIELSESISQFLTYLQAKSASAAANTLLMTYSDFARRPNSNSSAGTDHGTASIHIIAGGGVKGGVYGTYPNFSSLDPDGNTLVTIDFRNQISDVVAALGANPAAIVGSNYPKIGFI